MMDIKSRAQAIFEGCINGRNTNQGEVKNSLSYLELYTGYEDELESYIFILLDEAIQQKSSDVYNLAEVVLENHPNINDDKLRHFYHRTLMIQEQWCWQIETAIDRLQFGEKILGNEETIEYLTNFVVSGFDFDYCLDYRRNAQQAMYAIAKIDSPKSIDALVELNNSSDDPLIHEFAVTVVDLYHPSEMHRLKNGSEYITYLVVDD